MVPEPGIVLLGVLRELLRISIMYVRRKRGRAVGYYSLIEGQPIPSCSPEKSHVDIDAKACSWWINRRKSAVDPTDREKPQNPNGTLLDWREDDIMVGVNNISPRKTLDIEVGSVL